MFYGIDQGKASITMVYTYKIDAADGHVDLTYKRSTKTAMFCEREKEKTTVRKCGRDDHVN